MLGCYLDQKHDYAFRRIFGSQKRVHVLRQFLNGVLHLEDANCIEQLRIADRHNVPRLDGMKETVMDVRCVDHSGREFIVEMQVCDKRDFEHRSLYYVSQSYTEQLKKGEPYTMLRKVTLLAVLDFQFLRSPHYLSNHLILDKETGEHRLKDFEFTFLELPKFTKKQQQLATIEEKWSYFFKCAAQTPLHEIPKTLHEPEIEEAFRVLETIGHSETENRLYQKAEKDRRDRIAEIGKGYDKGYNKGLQEGHEKGAKKKAVEIARAMRAKGLDEEMIAQMTGLPPRELEALD
ncbi:MAG: Rpn family recombination-promoting nuclease/putative transposase [Myxococcota bacterium]